MEGPSGRSGVMTVGRVAVKAIDRGRLATVPGLRRCRACRPARTLALFAFRLTDRHGSDSGSLFTHLPWTPGWTNGVWLRPNNKTQQAPGVSRTMNSGRATVLPSDPQQSTIELDLSSEGKRVLVTIGIDRDPAIAAAILKSIRPG
jgi:hypothetical protein